MSDDTSRLLIAIERNTREIADWLFLAYGDLVKEKLETLLSDDKRKIAYQCSVEGNSSRAVAGYASVNDRTIRGWWKEWLEEEIVEESETPGRFKRRFDLRRFGIVIPPMKKAGP